MFNLFLEGETLDSTSNLAGSCWIEHEITRRYRKHIQQKKCNIYRDITGMINKDNMKHHDYIKSIFFNTYIFNRSIERNQ